MTEFEKIYQNYNPRQAALDEARALLTAAAKAAMADGALPEAELPAFIVEIPADTKNGDIASNIAMACAISVTSRGVVTSTPGVSYLSITRLETGSEYLSKQSHSISNIGAGAEQPRQHRWPRTSRLWWSAISGLPASSYEVEPDVTPPCPDSLPSGLASSPARSGSWCAVATPC